MYSSSPNFVCKPVLLRRVCPFYLTIAECNSYSGTYGNVHEKQNRA